MMLFVDGLDYQLMQGQLQFSTGNERLCVNIELLSDLVTEGVEEFNVSLTTTEDRITFMQPYVHVIISDNNGEYNSTLPCHILQV